MWNARDFVPFEGGTQSYINKSTENEDYTTLVVVYLSFSFLLTIVDLLTVEWSFYLNVSRFSTSRLELNWALLALSRPTYWSLRCRTLIIEARYGMNLLWKNKKVGPNKLEIQPERNGLLSIMMVITFSTHATSQADIFKLESGGHIWKSRKVPGRKCKIEKQ